MTSELDYRRLIKFGNSSHVISVPKRWLEKNSLKKGDMVYCYENGTNELVLSCSKENGAPKYKEITINVDGKGQRNIWRELIAAYLNSYNVIRLQGNSILNHEDQVKAMIHDLIALEIVEQTGNTIVTKDFMNMKDLTLTELLKRMEIIVRSMIVDLKQVYEKDYGKSFVERDKDINRIFFAFRRGLRYALNYPNCLKEQGLDTMALFQISQICSTLEKIGDRLKCIAECAKKSKLPPESKKILHSISVTLEEAYIEILKAYYKKDVDRSFLLAEKRDEIQSLCDGLTENPKSDAPTICIAQNIREIASGVHEVLHNIHDNQLFE